MLLVILFLSKHLHKLNLFFKEYYIEMCFNETFSILLSNAVDNGEIHGFLSQELFPKETFFTLLSRFEFTI